MRRFIALLLLIGVCGSTSQSSAAVSINFDQTYAEVDDGFNRNTDYLTDTRGGTAIAMLPGYGSITTNVLTTAGDSAGFSGSFDQFRQGNLNGYAYGRVVAYFTTDVDVPYVASGTLFNSAGFSDLFGYLFDNTAKSYVFQSDQESQGVPSLFTLGGLDGNYSNYFDGSLTGTLLAGHNYSWVTDVTIAAFPVVDLGATASGGVSLTIGAVPEFSSAIVWSLLTLTIAGIARWQRSKLTAENRHVAIANPRRSAG